MDRQEIVGRWLEKVKAAMKERWTFKHGPIALTSQHAMTLPEPVDADTLLADEPLYIKKDEQ